MGSLLPMPLISAKRTTRTQALMRLDVEAWAIYAGAALLLGERLGFDVETVTRWKGLMDSGFRGAFVVVSEIAAAGKLEKLETMMRAVQVRVDCGYRIESLLPQALWPMSDGDDDERRPAPAVVRSRRGRKRRRGENV